MTVPWSEGGLEDFGDLHSAIDDGLTQKFTGEEDYDSEAGSDQESESGNESDEEEVEPSPGDHGNAKTGFKLKLIFFLIHIQDQQIVSHSINPHSALQCCL